MLIVNKSPSASASVPSTNWPSSPTPPQCLSVESLQLPSAAKVPMSAASGQTHRRIVIGAGMPAPHRSRPPLRFDRTFLEERDNQLKLIQLLFGLVAFMLTVQCWPNPLFPYCLGRIVDFFQLFNAVCVHGFFLIGTFFLALAHLFSAPDAFYYYNFSLLEQFYCGLAAVMYLIGSVFAILNMSRAIFALLWFFHLCLSVESLQLPSAAKVPMSAASGQTHRRIVIGAGMPAPHRSRPPLRFDRTFLEERDNQLKLIQLLFGLVAFMLTVQCWPNPLFPYCLGRIVDFFQLFNAVCVHGFFLIGTFFLALAHLFSAPDAFYYYNFSLLEQFYCGLAAVMYLIGSVFAILNMSRAIFALLWFFHLFVTLACLGLYTFDLWTRWKRDKQFKKDQQHNQSAYIT
uniref:MARVEL domain-containing protein n=1 Tax=Globodera pallida TaxID=36090 RepID=A0A183BNX2_GLOPA